MNKRYCSYDKKETSQLKSRITYQNSPNLIQNEPKYLIKRAFQKMVSKFILTDSFVNVAICAVISGSLLLLKNKSDINNN